MTLNLTTEQHGRHKLHVDPSRITELIEQVTTIPEQKGLTRYKVKLDHYRDYFYIDEETAEHIKQYLNRFPISQV